MKTPQIIYDMPSAESKPEPRMAKCSCGKTEPSSPDLPFYEFMGEGSRRAKTSCKNCGYAEVAHTPEVMAKNSSLKCVNFEPHGPYQFDDFYCGCWGWD